jgi:hypothetical protein
MDKIQIDKTILEMKSKSWPSERVLAGRRKCLGLALELEWLDALGSEWE